MLEYRRDIDGLRAVAVLSVVAYHAKISPFSGGFVGVDVFFVISGYLITSLIIKDITNDQFSIWQFYERRVRRIFPALFVVLFATSAVGSLILFPNDLQSLGKSLVASTLFFSNMYFLFTSDYFAGPANDMPLLHTWSLSVEEQFYIFFPIFMLVLYRLMNGRLGLWLWVVSCLSFALSVWAVRYQPAAAFYLLPTRAWELALGSVVAIGAFPVPNRERLRNLLSVGGVLLVLCGIFFLSDETPFPGFWALPPCIGAAIIISSGAESMSARLLGFRPIVFVGLISYSLYLWHWPVIVLYRLYMTTDIGIYGRVTTIVVSLILAVLTWQYVEKPFRSRRVAVWRLTWPVSATATMALFTIFGATVATFGNPWGQYSPEANAIAEWGDYRETEAYQIEFRPGVCLIGSMHENVQLDKDACLGISNDKKNVLIIGDSHAAHLWKGMQVVLPEINFLQATASGCRPLIDATGDAYCTDMISWVFKNFIPKTRLDGIVLAGRWRQEEISDLMSTIEYISKFIVPILVVGPAIEYASEFPILLAKSIYYNDPELPSRNIVPERRKLDQSMEMNFKASKTKYISSFAILCPDNRCLEYVDGGVPVQFDYGHYTLPGSIYVASKMAPVIAQMVDAGPVAQTSLPKLGPTDSGVVDFIR